MTTYLICALITAISAAVSCGFSIDAVKKAAADDIQATVNAKYALSRSAAILIVTFGLIWFHSTTYLILLAIIMILIQLFDGIIGLKVSRFKTVGPLLTALLNSLALFALLR